MSTLRTNSIQTVAGKTILNSTGSIVQVVQGIRTAELTTSQFSWVSAISATITPLSSTNRILIMAEAKVGSVSDYGVGLRLVRGGTPIYLGDLNGSRTQMSSWSTTYSSGSSTRGYNMTTETMMFLDSPATTSATTYSVQISAYTGSTSYMNRTAQWQQGGTAGYDGCPASSITLLEVSA